MKYINATEMMADETEAYLSAQSKITDKVNRDVNYVIHHKIQKLLEDAPAEDVIPVRPLIDKLNLWLTVPGYSESERNIIKATLYEILNLRDGAILGKEEK